MTTINTQTYSKLWNASVDPYSFTFPNQTGKILKCLKANDGYFYCFDKNCKNFPILCQNQQCQCKNLHLKCQLIMIKGFNAKIQQSVMPSQHLVNNLEQICQKAIQQILSLKQQILNELRLYGLGENQKKYAEFFSNQNILDTKSFQFQTIFSPHNLQLIYSQANKQSLLKSQTINSKLIKKISNQLQLIKKQFHTFQGQVQNVSNKQQLPMKESDVVEKNKEKSENKSQEKESNKAPSKHQNSAQYQHDPNFVNPYRRDYNQMNPWQVQAQRVYERWERNQDNRWR